MRRYPGDPYWTQAKYRSRCRRCGKKIFQGDPLWYYPRSRTPYCKTCGEQEEQRFLSEACDEEVYQGTGGPYAW